MDMPDIDSNHRDVYSVNLRLIPKLYNAFGIHRLGNHGLRLNQKMMTEVSG